MLPYVQSRISEQQHLKFSIYRTTSIYIPAAFGLCLIEIRCLYVKLMGYGGWLSATMAAISLTESFV